MPRRVRAIKAICIVDWAREGYKQEADKDKDGICLLAKCVFRSETGASINNY